jgi:antitoxin component of MazEF toxin-antitoxin module
MRFRTTVELGGKTATGMRVPAEVVAALGAGKRPRVTVTINGGTYRSTVAAYKGAYMLPVSAENRQVTGVSAGDEVDVDLELDVQPREVAVPADLAEALDRDPAVRRRFDALAFTHQGEWVRSVEDAKKPETRRRRIDKAVESLST